MTNTSPASGPPSALGAPFRSDLSDGKQRFLSQVVVHALESHLRSAKDFVRHFPPSAIMSALTSQPRLRANIVVPTIGLHEKVALKKSAESTGDDLQIALDEGVTDEEAIVQLFEPDDRVRYLDERDLWSFVVERDFWKATSAQAGEVAVAKQNVAYMVDSARANGLISAHDVVEGLTLGRILDALPKSELTTLVRFAAAGGLEGRRFDDEALLSALPPSALLEHVPLALMWASVVVVRVAVPQGLVVEGSATLPPSPDAREIEEFVVEVVESESDVHKQPLKVNRSRRVGAMDLSQVKSEIEDRHRPKD